MPMRPRGDRYPRMRLIVSTDSKVAIITGASQGIREGLVREYLARGYRVVANSPSIRSDACKGDGLAVAGDIPDPAVAERVVGGAVAMFGRVDTLVNNAGAFVPGRSPSTPRTTTPGWSR